MVLIRKSKPGADSFGHEWPDAGSVVDVDPGEAQQLLAISDGGFSVADPDPEPEPEPEELHVVNPDDGPQVGAPDPEVLAGQPPAEDDPAGEDETPEDLSEGPAEPEQPVDEAPAPAKPRSARSSRKN